MAIGGHDDAAHGPDRSRAGPAPRRRRPGAETRCRRPARNSSSISWAAALPPAPWLMSMRPCLMSSGRMWFFFMSAFQDPGASPRGTEEPALPGLWCRPPPAEGERGEAAKRRRGWQSVRRESGRRCSGRRRRLRWTPCRNPPGFPACRRCRRSCSRRASSHRAGWHRTRRPCCRPRAGSRDQSGVRHRSSAKASRILSALCGTSPRPRHSKLARSSNTSDIERLGLEVALGRDSAGEFVLHTGRGLD